MAAAKSRTQVAPSDDDGAHSVAPPPGALGTAAQGNAATQQAKRLDTPGGGGDGEGAFRVIHANQPTRNAGFVDNLVITSQYTALNFVPLFLWQQFTRFANAYFLVVSVMQMIKSISITNGIPYSLVPLLFVVLFDGVVTAQEDYSRHKADDHDNSKPCQAVRGGKMQRVSWRDLRVGDVVRIQRGQALPADILFMCAVSDDAEPSDVCYVQTAQLDGETNLKLRSSLQETVEVMASDEEAAKFRGVVECEPPNEFFDKFTGVVQLQPAGTAGARKFPLEANNVLLRGCVLRNVRHIYGIVVYTGRETKVRVKQQIRNMKVASVESVINTNILIMVVGLGVVCVTCAIGWAVWSNESRTAHPYLMLEAVDFGSFIGKIGTFFLLNAACVPVSLYVSMKLARTLQKYFMEKDRLMYHEEPELIRSSNGLEGHFPMRVRSMDLNDELGRIGYVFSDKTGTLTLNYMQFKKMLIHGVSYGLGTTQIGLDRMRRLGITPPEGAADEDGEEGPKLDAQGRDGNGRVPVPHVTFKDGSDSHPGRAFFTDIVNPVHGERLKRFMLHLVLNHTVIPETVRDDEGNVTGMQLSASSPDEEAFVYAGEYFGFKFLKRRGPLIQIDVQGTPTTFKVLYILAYNQMRKRMSVIVEDDEGECWLYVKGADTVLYERLRESESKEESDNKLMTAKSLCDWGNDGLRTLVFAYRKLRREYLDTWAARYEKARADMNELNKRKNKEPNLIDTLMEEMESELLLQGATANEDKLQPQVPETIDMFARAGINIWMLTGDKQETAINIGFATKLLTDTMDMMLYTSDEMKLDRIVENLKSRAAKVRTLIAHGKIPSPAWALVINEKALDYTLDRCSQELMEVARACKAVICCRARPDQKGKMVALIKNGVPGTRTLAVGDGANDVDMIKEAHVGVGIAGAEGVQAANASDFSIGRFKFLQRLLLVHGRWNYRRMSKLVCYMFYKNICLVVTQLLYSLYTGWSGQKFYIELLGQGFNLAYTGAPILYLAVLDQDISAENCLRFPMVYAEGPLGRRLNKRVFWGWVLSAVAEALVLFYIPYWSFDSPDSLGSPYVFQLGLCCLTGVVLATSMRVAIETHLHHWSFTALLLASALSLFPTAWFFAAVFDADGMKGGVSRTFATGSFWFMLPIMVFLASVRTAAVKIYRRYFKTELRHVVKEAQQITNQFGLIERWSAEAFTHVQQGTTYDGTIPKAKKVKSAGATPTSPKAVVAWEHGTPTQLRQRDKLRPSSVGKAAETSQSAPLLVSPARKVHPGDAESKSAAAANGVGSGDTRESARTMWHKLRAAQIITFSHMYTGYSYSEDPTSTATLIDRFAAGHSRLRSTLTAPPELWPKQAPASKRKPAHMTP